MVDYLSLLVSSVVGTDFLILIPNVVAGVGLTLLYKRQLEAKTLVGIFIGFAIYTGIYAFALILFPFVVGILMGDSWGVEWLLIFGIMYSIPLCLIGYVLQLFFIHFVLPSIE